MTLPCNPHGLSGIQIQMLEAGEFHVDGWTTQAGRNAAADLEERGLLVSFKGGSDQYTSINCTVTPAGHFALARTKGRAIEGTAQSDLAPDPRT
jgi:hypothetical protein